MAEQQYRIEHDTMGEVRVPVNALWRAQTQRAVENFPISFRPLERAQIRAMGLLKAAAAQVNQDLGLLAPEKAAAIVAAAQEIADGLHDDQFPIDVFQTGSGTSSNMNMNEVLATLASRILGHSEPRSYAEFLRQRVETNYLTGALLIPEEHAVPVLQDAKARRALSIEDLRDAYSVSYETAAHRFTNLATQHLGAHDTVSTGHVEAANRASN